MKICFYGASVTEQSIRHDTGEVTGYVDVFSRLVGKNGYEVCRVSAGSSSIEDAGVVYADRVVETGCDVCVLDWCTATSPECSFESILYVYKRLLDSNIVPITVIFPRSDRDQVSIDVSRKSIAFCNKHNLPLLDLTSLLKPENQKVLLRDTVHTTPQGAETYAIAIFNYLNEFNFRAVDTTTLHQVMLPFFVTRLSTAQLGSKISSFRMRVVPGEQRAVTFRTLLEQRVGPWSGILSITINGQLSHKCCLFDPWCWRERQCVKLISEDVIISTEAEVEFLMLEDCPDYRVLGARMDTEFMLQAESKHLRPKGHIFVICSDPTALVMLK